MVHLTMPNRSPGLSTQPFSPPPDPRCAARRSRCSSPRTRTPSASPQRVDQEYTALIQKHLQDPRISTELVDHLPASATVPSPLKFFGRIVGTPGELTYAKDIHRYYQALAAASKRARYWKIGTTEEGRDIVVLAIADEASIASLDKYRYALQALTDPRATTEREAQQLIETSKPIYYVTSGMHSTENGGPEMLIELAYRLIVQETPFIQAIRNNVITLITPVLEVDGREKQVDTYYFNKKRAEGDARLPLMYWGKYVQHDNNRDGMGQYLELTKAVMRLTLDWRPTILHDLHEAQTYLYSSTGTGPYNEALDPITVSEWWTLAQADVLELTKRGVPGVWTYGFYDGWVPNYMIFIAHSHNAVGRFYEVQGYGPDPYDVRPQAAALSREWFRPNPPLPFIKWGPRNNTNIQQSALLVSLNHVAKNRQVYLENYWIKNKRAVEKGRTGAVNAWVIPAAQRRKADTATAVNDLRRQGLEISRATAAFTAGGVDVKAGDYVVRGDQPYPNAGGDVFLRSRTMRRRTRRRTTTPGWTFQLMRDIRVLAVGDKSILAQKMPLVTADVRASGGIEGHGPCAGRGTHGRRGPGDASASRMPTFACWPPRTTSSSAAARCGLARSSCPMPGERVRRTLASHLESLGLSAWAVADAPAVKTHELDIPRIGYVHSWTRTQDEGWWRAALDTYGVPYVYLADQELRAGNLRAQFDVLLFPHVGGSAVAQVNGMAIAGGAPLPYRKTPETPNLGALDSSDDIRGGMGLEGLAELARFVREGGTLITEGSTATIFPEYGLTTGVTVETPRDLFVRGSILRGRIADAKSPIVYGYAGGELPVYFSQAPVLNAGGVAAGRGAAPQNPNAGIGQIVTPNVAPLPISPFEPEGPMARPLSEEAGRARGDARRDSADAATGAAGAGRHPLSPGRGRDASVGYARQRPVAGQPRGRGQREGGRRTGRDVRAQALLALADTRHLHAGVQRDHELERSGGGTVTRAHQSMLIADC